jgi:hypothetical protein
MKRRDFITLLGGAAAAWPLTARSQQPAKLPTIGFFSPNTRSAAGPWTAAFVERLREIGWIEGRTVAIEYRWGEGRGDRTAEVVAEFIRFKPDVIVTHGEYCRGEAGDVGNSDCFRVGDGPLSYGPNFADLFRRAADYVDKILRGTKPGELPVEQPTRFDLVINLTTATALGLTIPESFLLRADEVIE